MDTGKPSRTRAPLLQCAPITTEHGGASIRLGGQSYTFQGQDTAQLLDNVMPHINGYSTRDEIADAIATTGAMTRPRAYEFLGALVDMGICVEDHETAEDRGLRTHYLPQVMYFGRHLSHPTHCQQQLQASTVTVIGLDQIGSQLVQRLAEAGIGGLKAAGNPEGLRPRPHPQPLVCQTSGHAQLANRVQSLGWSATYEGIELTPETPLDWGALLADCDVAVLVLPQIQPHLLQAFNQAALNRGIRFMPICLDASGARIGPLVKPYETACLLCQYWRQNAYLGPDALPSTSPPAAAPNPTYLPIAWASAVAAIAAGDITMALSGVQRPSTEGYELTLDLYHWQLQPTPVLKLPRCPACSRLRHHPSTEPFALHDLQGAFGHAE